MSRCGGKSLQTVGDAEKSSRLRVNLVNDFKGSIFLKNRHFIIQGRFNKMIYGINTIIKCGT